MKRILLISVDELKPMQQCINLHRDAVLCMSFMGQSNKEYKVMLPFLLSDERLAFGDRYYDPEEKKAKDIIDNLHAILMSQKGYQKVLKTPSEFSLEELKMIVDGKYILHHV